MTDFDVTSKAKEIGDTYYEKRKFENLPWYVKSVITRQEKEISKILSKGEYKSILEIGCGYGRFTEILEEILHPKKFVAVDLNYSLIEIAKKRLSNNIEFHCSSIQDFKSNEKFELVFCGVILMMISKKDIEEVIKKIISLSTKKIITIDPIEYYPGKTKEYAFIHNYKEIFERLGGKNVKMYEVPIPFSSRIVSKYAKFRGRSPITKQGIFEVDIE
jgi:SAM-dependent methyltransferase